MTIPALDLRQIRFQVQLWNSLVEAGEAPAFLRLVSDGIDPDRPVPLPAEQQRFSAGAIDPVTEAVMRLNRQPGRNVRLGGGLDEGDFGFAIELRDADHGAWLPRLPFSPSAVLSGAGRRVTAIYLLERTEHPAVIAPIAERVAEFAKGEVLSAAAGWPIAGTVDYAAAGKPVLIEQLVPWQRDRISTHELCQRLDDRPQRVRLDAVNDLEAEASEAVDARIEDADAGDGDDAEADNSGAIDELAARLQAQHRRLEIGSDVELSRKIARELVARFGEIPYSEGSFWVYHGSAWEALDPFAMRRLVHAFDGAGYTTPSGKPENVRLSKNRVDSTLSELAAIFTAPDFFRYPATGINCRNGFVSFLPDGTPQLEPHRREHRCRHTLPGKWDRWMHEVAEDPPPDSWLYKLLDGCFRGDPDCSDKGRFMSELAGAAATGQSTRLRQPKGVIFEGEHANNGKSQWLDALRGMLPPMAVSALSASKFSDDRHVVHLRGKFLNAPDELSASSVIASDVFKKVITGDPVTGRDVYKSAIEFRPVALNIFATNVLPLFTGGFDRGVQRRLAVLQFGRVIPSEERVEGLGRRVATEESDLLIGFAVAGAQRLLRNGYYTEPASSKAALRAWLYSGDPTLAWIRARLRPLDPKEYVPGFVDLGVPSQEAYRDFRAWAKDAGYRENLLPAVNGFCRKVSANAEYVRVVHTNVGNRLKGCVIGDVKEVAEEEAD